MILIIRKLLTMIHYIIIWTLAVCPVQFVQSADLQYPEVCRNESCVDDYHGTKDDLRIDLDSMETKTFVSNQKALAKDFFAQIEARLEIYSKVTQLVDYPKWSAPIQKNGKYFYYHNSGLQNHAIFYVQEQLDSDESRVLVDPNILSEDGSISMGYYQALSPNGEIFVYSLSKNGSDWLTGRFVNTTSGIALADVLENIKWPDFTWSQDGLGLFYSRFPIDENENPISVNPQIYYHNVGTLQAEDKFIVDYTENPQWFLMAEVTDCGEYLLLKPQPDFKANSIMVAKLEGSALTSEFQLIFSANLGSRFIYVANSGNSFTFLSDHEAPNFRLIRLSVSFDTDAAQIYNYTVLVPEHDKNILKWVSAFDGDKLILCYFEDVKHKLEVRDLEDGSFVQDIPLDEGIISEHSISKANDEFFFKFENLVVPGTIYRCAKDEGKVWSRQLKCDIYKEMKLRNNTQIDLHDFTMRQVFFPSKDGTIIPMFIAHKKDLMYNGNAPTLMLGYGGFNVDQLPNFSPFHMAFMDYFDGVFASPNIRGGAEYGEKWHQSGMLLNKQNTFDDFQAAAEYLIREKYTSPSKLTIQGSSNGGLLVGACVNQRPDLFAVALPDVGLMDMLRFNKFAIGYAWCSEYGCPENLTHFKNLRSYSPIHNIKFPTGGSSYPSILVSTADHDDRVVPSHSYKYVAQLQHLIGHFQENPIILRIEENAGHNGDEKPTSKRIEDYSDAFAFIAQHLNKHQNSASHGAKSSTLRSTHAVKVILVVLCVYFCSFAKMY